MKVEILVAYLIFTATAVTGQDNFIPLATTDCCFKKQVGGVSYTLVSGRTSTEGYGCKDACTYEEDGNPGGSQYCFANGQMEVQCLNSEDDFKGVPVTYSIKDDNTTDWISFNTDIGLINCTVDTVLPFVGPSKDIQCSLQSGESDSTTQMSREGPELLADTDVPFVTSKDDGHLTWFSLYSKDVSIDCDITDDLPSSCTANIGAYYNYIYVEDSLPLEYHIDTWEKCSEVCNKNYLIYDNKKIPYPCTFWTFSDIAEKEWGRDNDGESRNHIGENECGIRNYYPVRGAIPTVKGQSCGVRGGKRLEKAVYVANYGYTRTAIECHYICHGDHKCKSTTYSFAERRCVLNYGETQRKIKICPFIGGCKGQDILVSRPRDWTP